MYACFGRVQIRFGLRITVRVRKRVGVSDRVMLRVLN